MLEKLLDKKYDEIKQESDLEKKATDIVNILFDGKFDKGRKPYIEHLLYIRDNVNTKNQRIIGLLHDTIEDLNIKKEELIDVGFPENIVDVIEILSRKSKPKEDYNDYIERIIN